jgi:hypothetical protein
VAVIEYRPAVGQVVPLIVLGMTPGLRRALDATGIGYVECDDPEVAVEHVDACPGAVVGYGPDVFGRALSARRVRIEPADADSPPIRALVLVDEVPADMPPGVVDDDPRRLMHKARTPLRCRTWADLSDPECVEALLRTLATPPQVDPPPRGV